MKAISWLFRNEIFPLAMKVGVDKIIRPKKNKKLLHVMYHGVFRDTIGFSKRNLDPKQFEEQIQYLNNDFDIISLEECFHLLENKIKLKKNTISISFDDGFLNNLTVALPILEKYKAKATVFVSGICAQNNKFPVLLPEIVAGLKYFYSKEVIKVDGKTFNDFREKHTNVSLLDYINSLDYKKRETVIKQLLLDYNLEQKFSTIPQELWRLLSPTDLKNLCKSPLIKIGSHAYYHLKLAELNNLNLVENELLNSKILLEKTLNTKIDTIAYPYGSYNSKIKDLAEKCGYNYQLAVNYLYKDDVGDHRIQNRHGISTTTTMESNILMINRALKTKGLSIQNNDKTKQ